jgi:hypothetical protein
MRKNESIDRLCLQECLLRLMSSKTVMYVTHQLEFLQDSDIVLVRCQPVPKCKFYYDKEKLYIFRLGSNIISKLLQIY